MTPQPPTRACDQDEGRCFSRRRRSAIWRTILAAALMAGGLPALAQAEQTEQAGQTDPTVALASRSAVVVLGTVLAIGASDEPLLAPSSATAVIRIDKMYAGSELAGDQTGHNATVILSKPGEVKVGTQALFFGNPRYIGKTLTIADLGEMPAPPPAETGRVPRALEEGLRARRDAPLKARLATAAMVIRGTVESVRPLPAPATPGRRGRPALRDEHDPDWQVATVRVDAAIRGVQNRATVAVVFAASKDIMWFRSPKLRAGESALILGQPAQGEPALPREAGAASYLREHHAVVVTSPFDVLPAADEQRVVELLRRKEVQ
jgi:hypothetical protein